MAALLGAVCQAAENDHYSGVYINSIQFTHYFYRQLRYKEFLLYL
ncbi:hypothetical protein MHB50_06080 [Siminovitchia sp. FSL H7-0308]